MNRILVTGLAVSIASVAFGHGGDVGLLLDGDRIVTALADDVTGGFSNIGERVFGSEIDFVSNLGDEPGFFSTDGPTLPVGFDAFAAGTTITYQNNGAIRAWNGSGFEATSNQLRQIQIPGVLEILSPTDDSVVPGFEFAYSGGEFDAHSDYAMLDDSTAGIFLWNISFSALDGSGGLIASSDDTWIVFNFGMSELAHDAAIEWAETNIPAPGALSVLGVAGVVATRRRRN